MTDKQEDPDELLTPSEVAAMFKVDAKTVTRWAKNGKLPYLRTIGGHHRFRRGDVTAAAAAVYDSMEATSPRPC